MSLFENRSKLPPAHGINVTPLIDVLLVLLIIFMVIQPQREAKLPVKAAAPLSDGPPVPETLMLTVTGDMLLELNSRPIELGELLSVLGDLMEQRSVEVRTLFIKAPPILAYGSVALLIDLAKGAGVVTVGLVQDDA